MDQLNKYDSNDTFFNESIGTWVDLVHTELSKQYEMPKKTLDHKQYGFEAYASVLRSILSNISTGDIMDAMKGQVNFRQFVALAHAAWSDNYIKWKNMVPQDVSNNPKKSINTIERNDRATTQSKNLNAADMAMYQDMIVVVFGNLSKKILEAEFQSMAL